MLPAASPATWSSSALGVVVSSVAGPVRVAFPMPSRAVSVTSAPVPFAKISSAASASDSTMRPALAVSVIACPFVFELEIRLTKRLPLVAVAVMAPLMLCSCPPVAMSTVAPVTEMAPLSVCTLPVTLAMPPA